MPTSAPLAAPALALSIALALGGCATVDAADPPRIERGAEGRCDAAAAQRLVGSKATADTGAEIIRLTGAAIFQWVPPGAAVTMDYRANRVRTGYSADYTITDIRCG